MRIFYQIRNTPNIPLEYVWASNDPKSLWLVRKETEQQLPIFKSEQRILQKLAEKVTTHPSVTLNNLANFFSTFQEIYANFLSSVIKL